MAGQLRCQCQDSRGDVCNKPMTKTQYKQDGMCDVCACHVFDEMFKGVEEWYHNDQPLNTDSKD